MKVTVEGRVVAGTGNGGEDLYLFFRCKEFDNEPVEVELVEGPGVSLSDNVDELEEEDFDEDGEPNPEKVVHTFRSHYEFEWSGTLGDLRKKAVEQGLLDEKQWCWVGPCSEPPKKEFRRSVFVDGNAD